MNINFILGYTTEITNSLKTNLARPRGDLRIKIQIAQGLSPKRSLPRYEEDKNGPGNIYQVSKA